MTAGARWRLMTRRYAGKSAAILHEQACRRSSGSRSRLLFIRGSHRNAGRRKDVSRRPRRRPPRSSRLMDFQRRPAHHRSQRRRRADLDRRRQDLGLALQRRVGADLSPRLRRAESVSRLRRNSRQRFLLRPIGLAQPAWDRELRLARRRQRRRRLVGLAAARRSVFDLERRRERAQRTAWDFRSATRVKTTTSRPTSPIPMVARSRACRFARTGRRLHCVRGRVARVAYFGANVFFETRDRGRTWAIVSPDLTRNDPSKQLVAGGPINTDVSGAEFYDTIFDIAPSQLEPGTHLGRNRRRLSAVDDRRGNALAERYAGADSLRGAASTPSKHRAPTRAALTSRSTVT